MTQSQLVGKNGDVQSEEGMHKRLKISVPHFDNYDLIKGYSKTLIGRCRNPAEQDIKALIVTFSKIWNLVDRVVGVDLGLGRFQFDSDHEEDIEAVLQMQPYHFDYWMVSLDLCPMNIKTPDVRSQEKKKMKENRDRDDGKHDDRARSYKGVVIKGNNDVQDKEREKREYYGKGKGKMIEEPESRWTKVSDRGNKRYNGYNGNKGHFRGMEEGSRHRSRRWEPARAYTHEERHPHGGRRERSPRVVIREDAREEGEVQTKQPGKVQLNQSMPSAVFQVDLAKTQAEPTEVNLALVDDDASLYLANEALENVELGDDLMVMEDNIGIEDIVENQDKVGEDFQDLTDEELEEESKKENGGEAVGGRRKPIKPLVLAGGSTKMKMVQAMLSPRKNNASKASNRPRETSKQTEEKVLWPRSRLIPGSLGLHMALQRNCSFYPIETSLSGEHLQRNVVGSIELAQEHEFQGLYNSKQDLEFHF
ncbi:hypothetical protein Bca101_059240 [Brassica carinata]